MAPPIRLRTSNRSRAWCGTLIVLLGAMSCAAERDPVPAPEPALEQESDLASGLLLAGPAEPIRTLLATASTASGTVLGAQAADALERVASCTHVAARSPQAKLVELLTDVGCASGSLLALARREAPRIVVWLPREGGRRLTGEARVGPGGAVEVFVETASPTGSRSSPLGLALWPARAPSRASPLKTTGALVAAHWAVSPAALVEAGEQAASDALGGLVGSLAEVALTGSWSLCVLPGDGPSGLLPAALALGHRSPAAAGEGLERLVAHLEEEFGAHREPVELEGVRGLCLPDLELVPGLAPCGLVMEHHLVFAVNEPALRRIVASSAEEEAGEAAVNLDLDALVQGEGARAADFPWGRMRLAPVARGGRSGLLWSLKPGEGAR